MDNTKLDTDFEKNELIAKHDLEISRCIATMDSMQKIIEDLSRKLFVYQSIDKKKKKKKGKDH